MTRMFKTVTRTWNPCVGCLHGCTYCWARNLAETKLKDSPRYRDGFQPKFIASELRKKFKPGEFVFVSDMGDLFGEWVPEPWILRVLDVLGRFPETRFLLQTKNPCRMLGLDFPENVYLGTTIETNYNYPVSKAPTPRERCDAMITLRRLERLPRFLSIEPIMDFDFDELVRWIFNIQPTIIEVGVDNYNNHLPEPSWDKVERLLIALRKICPDVKEKDGLGRLKG